MVGAILHIPTLNCGAGWGHGVGLCQIGALGMAMAGKSKDEVLMHYYMNSEITKIY